MATQRVFQLHTRISQWLMADHPCTRGITANGRLCNRGCSLREGIDRGSEALVLERQLVINAGLPSTQTLSMSPGTRLIQLRSKTTRTGCFCRNGPMAPEHWCSTMSRSAVGVQEGGIGWRATQ